MVFDSSELFEEYKKRASQVINITVGALIHYINSETFVDLTEDQKDQVFEYVVTAWGTLLPPQTEKMWMDQISFLALDQHMRDQETELDKNVIQGIFNELGWDFDNVEKIDGTN